MAMEVATVMGSGTLPYVAACLHTTLGGTFSGTLDPRAGQGRGVRVSTQVAIANPEDVVSVPAFAVSGITVGTASAVEIWSPGIHDALLRRRRNIKIQNLGLGDVFIGHSNQVAKTIAAAPATPGIKLVPNAASGITTIDLPLMGGVSVWAIAANANADIRVLTY